MFTRKATIVVDLGFGDSGKGTIVDYLARTSNTATVVRFNGGAQAAHNVHTTNGTHHTFAQFGSGTLVPGIKTHLSRFVLIDPPALLNEAQHLGKLGIVDALARLSIDERALIVTPFHKAGNRIREVSRGSGRHGSVGMGVGETKADEIAFPHQAVYAGDLRSPETLIKKFRFFQKLKFEEFQANLREIGRDGNLAEETELLCDPEIAERAAIAFWRLAMRLRIVDARYLHKLSLEGDLIFEGAQGVLIDEWHGFHPYTTWSTTTPENAKTLLREIGFLGETTVLGVLRAYFTRHGAGPFPTEDRALGALIPDPHNTFGRWQGGFRIGWFDSVLARYAISASRGIDALAITNTDRVQGLSTLKIATAYALSQPTRSETAAIALKKGSVERRTMIRDLKRKPFLTDLGYQEVLTGIANRATPIYESVSPEQIVDTVERELGVPVLITSHGPTAADKRRTAARLSQAA